MGAGAHGHFQVGPVGGDVLEGRHANDTVPSSHWHGNRQERPAHAVLFKPCITPNVADWLI
ncbi:hypothetical protein GCM10027411_07390 [Microbacterium aureliae]